MGNKDAFGTLVDLHRDAVFSICLSRCGNFADAQDLAQEAFIRAYTNLHQLRDLHKFSAWLYQITRGACVDWQRGQGHVSLPLDEAADLFAAPIEDVIFARETEYRVSNALLQLPEQHRLVASLHYLGGYTCEEIAEVAGTSVGIVWERLRTARRQLKRELFDRLSEDARLRKPGKGLKRRVLSGIASFEKEEIFTHMRALKAVLEYCKVRVDWDYLLGVSGEAFSIYTGPTWTYLSRFVHSWDVCQAACEGYAFRSKWHVGETFEAALKLIDESLQRGAPALVPGINPSVAENGGSECHYWFVVTDVDWKHSQLTLAGVGEQDCVVPFPWKLSGGERTRGWAGIIRCLDVHPLLIAQNPLCIVEAGGGCVDPRKTALGSIRRAVALAHEPPVDGDHLVFRGGLEALKTWGNDLRRLADEKITSYMLADGITAWHYGGVMDATSRRLEVSRLAAASYLHRLAESGLGLPSSKLIETANKYENVAHLARELFELYFDPEENIKRQQVIANNPKPVYFRREELLKFWKTFEQRFVEDPEQRRRGADIIDAIVDAETTAVRHLDSLAAEWGSIEDYARV